MTSVALEGKVALVMGASAGIGRAYALALAGAGATTVAAARTLGPVGAPDPPSHSLAEVVSAGRGLAGRLEAQVCDVEVEDDIVTTVDQTVANFGRLDVLVNNAGIMTGFDPLAVGGDDWDRIMRTNLRSAYLAIRQAAPHMIRQRSGSIVNVTARAAAFTTRDDPASRGTVAYGASKAALNRLSFYMAEELRPHGIAVNALSPGVVATDTAIALHPGLARPGRAKAPTPEVLGPALLCLAQQTAETLTGQILHTDEFGTSWP